MKSISLQINSITLNFLFKNTILILHIESTNGINYFKWSSEVIVPELLIRWPAYPACSVPAMIYLISPVWTTYITQQLHYVLTPTWASGCEKYFARMWNIFHMNSPQKNSIMELSTTASTQSNYILIQD